MSGGKIEDVVPPGIYSDFGLFVKMIKVNVSAIEFTAEDSEVFSKDSNSLGITVQGSAFRPSSADVEWLQELWPKYKNVYTSDTELLRVITAKSQQAMKSCVGERNFREAVIGTGRDLLKECISSEINELVNPYGLRVENIVVPNVILTESVKAQLDSIIESKLASEKAVEDEKKAVAEGLYMISQKEAEIRVQQSERLEKARQEIELAKLDRDRLVAEKEVIRAQKDNELLEAQKEFEIAQAKALSAAEQAKADLARELALAELYANNPNYIQIQIALANASAIKNTDKLIFTSEGTFPQLIFGEGILPTVPTTK
jgi:hypothetical protein